MKKWIYAICIIMCVFMLASCDYDKASNDTPAETNDDNSTVLMLDFTSLDKAITGFGGKNPFLQMRGNDFNPQDPSNSKGFWMAAGAMQNLPIIPGFTTMTKSEAETILKNKSGKYDAYGFPLSIDTNISKVTNDYIFVRYYIYDYKESLSNVNTDSKYYVGQIDYYYDINKKELSYREILTPFFREYGGDNVFLFELLDVPVNFKFSKNGSGNKQTLESVSFNVNEAGKYKLVTFYFDDLGNKEAQKGNVPYTAAKIIKYDVLMDYVENVANSGTLGCKVYSTVFNANVNKISLGEGYSLPDENSLTFVLGKLPEDLVAPFKATDFKEKKITVPDGGTLTPGIYNLFAYDTSGDLPKGTMVYQGTAAKKVDNDWDDNMKNPEAGFTVVMNGAIEEFGQTFDEYKNYGTFETFIPEHLKNCGVADPAAWLDSNGYSK